MPRKKAFERRVQKSQMGVRVHSGRHLPVFITAKPPSKITALFLTKEGNEFVYLDRRKRKRQQGFINLFFLFPVSEKKSNPAVFF